MNKKYSKIEDFFVHIVLILFSIWSVFPLLWILSTSFKPREDILLPEIHFLPQHFTWDNYSYLLTFSDGLFLIWLRNSIFIAILTTIVAIFMSTTAAYAFSRFKFPGRRAGLASFLITQMFPGVILIVPLYNIMRSLHLLNNYWGLILAYCTVALPFCVWMLKGFFDTIPVEIEEAAKIDGLDTWGTFYRILLPLSLPGIAVTAFFSFITAWNEFMFALTFMTDEKLFTLPVGLRTFVFEFRTDWNWMSAGAIIIVLPVILFFFIAQKYLVSGLTKGGVKG